MENFDNQDKEEIFSKRIPAGKRTYFFDVKATRGNELYLTVTESKKRVRDDGSFFYDKHKIFLYQEDFEKFMDGLNEAMAYIQENGNGPSTYVRQTESHSGGAVSIPVEHVQHQPALEEPAVVNRIEDISFDDLGN
jgi:hypothetical protein